MALSLYREGDRSQQPWLSVVVPIYNEQANIEPLYHALSDVLFRLRRAHEILFVDDGSQDGSSDVLRRLAQRDPRVKVVEFRRNFGQTAAMCAGVQYASGEYVVTMDGDMQNDPADIPMMLDKLAEGYDLVYGWRRQRQDAWLSRKLPSKVANWLIAKVTGFPAHDLGCSLKAMRGQLAHELPLYGEMHRFIPILAHAAGARCTEVITRHHPRRCGVTKYGIGRTFRVLLDLLTVQFMTRYAASPLKFFGRLGLGCGLLSVWAAAAAALGGFAQGFGLLTAALLVCAALGLTTGIQSIMLGLLGEAWARSRFDDGLRTYQIRRLLNFEDAALPATEADESRAA